MKSFSDMYDIINKWEEISKEYGNIEDDFDRLIRHYTGCRLFEKKSDLGRNILAWFSIPFFLYKLRRYKVESLYDYDAIVTAPNKVFLLDKENIPEKLLLEYSSFKYISYERNSLINGYKSYSLDESSYTIALNTYKKFSGNPFMVLSVILHLGRITSIIKQYNPRAIIVTQCEQDFTSAINTMYCESVGVKYICIQHGEYSYDPSMAYMRFSEYYAWSHKTIEQLELTNEKINFYHIYTPNHYKKRYSRRDEPLFFLTYYLSGENEDEIRKIKDLLYKFANAGYKCNVRIHPKHNIQNMIKSIFENTGISVENNNDVTISESLCNTFYVVSYRSTVLSEAYWNSMNIVIDDIVGDIELLIRVHDVNVSREHLRLSELVSKYLK